MANQMKIRPVKLQKEKFVLDGLMSLRASRFLMIFFTILVAVISTVATADISSGLVAVAVGVILGIMVESSAKPWNPPPQ